MFTGAIRFLRTGGKNEPLAYIRSHEGENVLVVLNPSDSQYRIDVTGLKETIYELGEKPDISTDGVTVKPASAFFAILG